MAYFGGTVSARPWAKVDVRFMLIFALSFCGLAFSIMLALDLPILSGVTQHASAAVAAPTTPEDPSQPILMPIVVANKDIPVGTLLQPSMFRLEARDIRGIEQHAIRTPEEIEGTSSRLLIAANAPLLRPGISRAPVSQDITNHIPTGYRAVAIPVNALTGVEGWIRPGATVDVVWSTQHAQQLVVSTIVENARILSVERSLEQEKTSKGAPPVTPSHITLLVLSADAQKIQLAKGSGSLNLSLRGIDDSTAEGSNILTSESLLTRKDLRTEIKGRVTIQGKEYGLYKDRLIPMTELQQNGQTN